MQIPYGVWTDGTRVIVADTFNQRVLIWNSYPTQEAAPADLVLGVPDFTTQVGGAVGPGVVFEPQGVFSDGKGLYVADTVNNRILVWNNLPASNGVDADFAIGQRDLTSNVAGTDEKTLRGPTHVVVAFGSLFVSDTGNNRILVFSPAPTTFGASAAAVLGQPTFFDGAALTQPAADRLNQPLGLCVVGSKLLVADSMFHRVLVFELTP
jgi:hypothetical protein